MQKLFRCIALTAFVAGFALPAAAGELKLTMANGRVTLIAQDVPLRQILAEWARVGQTRIVNGDKVAGPPLTLQLIDVTEDEALKVLLRSVAGYMAAPRAVSTPGPSVYDRIMILPTSRAPVQSASAPPAPFNRQAMPQPMPIDDDDGEPNDQPVPPPGMVPPGAQANPGQPVFPMPNAPGQQQPVVSDRPGPLPQPQVPPNPYAPPGTTVVRPPQPQTRPGPGGGGGH